MATATPTRDQTADQSPLPTNRIDTHHHLFPPKWLKEHTDDIVAVAPGIPPTLSLIHI